MNGLSFFTLSSLEKVRNKKPPVLWEEQGSALRGERYSFQAVLHYKPEHGAELRGARMKLLLPQGVRATVREVGQVPVTYAHKKNSDDYYLSQGDEILPDLLSELPEKDIYDFGNIWVRYDTYQAFWVTVEEAPSGVHPITLQLTYKDELAAQTTYTLTVIDTPLAKTDLFYTNWMHYDCIANYYGVKVWSEEFNRLVDAYISSAARHGMTGLYIPLFTPAIDTQVGSERTTVQLLDVTRKNGEYAFDFDRTVAFMKHALTLGIEYFEMAHLFTQWGLAAAPKIIVTADGEKKRMFGWDTPSDGEAYVGFLTALLPAFRERLIQEGLYTRCLWHLSDEPNEKHIEKYRALRALVRRLMPDAEVFDALSHYEFFEEGLVDRPIVALTAVAPFQEKNARGYGVYYCTGQDKNYVSNRFIAMPSERTRIIGMQLYLNGIKSFLHWGFNFWNNGVSIQPLDPYRYNDGMGAYESGDPYVVYPGKTAPLDSLRHELISDALSDYRALLTLEAKIGRDATCQILLDAGMKQNFNDYPHSPIWLRALREKINSEIAK